MGDSLKPKDISDKMIIEIIEGISTIRMRVACYTGWYAGMRASDVAKLKISEVDMNMHSITYVQKKTKAVRVVYVVEELRRILYPYIKYHAVNKEFIFASPFGNKEHVTAISLCQAFNRSMVNLGLDEVYMIDKKNKPRYKYSFHSLKHSFCNKVAKKVHDPFEAMAITGHKSFDAYRQYIHVRQRPEIMKGLFKKEEKQEDEKDKLIKLLTEQVNTLNGLIGEKKEEIISEV